ncbi:MAG TPA: Gfo/Idh/MocA family oxidoreductase [Planctomycetota bacterium]|nr:Gfo/Idh/MocA family oxidoreductase [Planctomycetota bacterium]HRR82883.1 Gfo/Idh/MocA family oxidoreductase [Planctomycetota bacterium]HRT94549.1 Gfo/Idh/MocA family oxidoreductase [Planctomycetota bacterium]
MSQPVRVAVVGAGHLGRHHARLYAGLPQAELVGIADVALDRAQRLAATYGVAAVADYHDLIEQVDAASIAVPTAGHFAVARDFIDRGRAVLIEKPFTRTLPEADELLSLAERRGATIQVGHVERFNPALIAAKGYLQDPLYVECDRISPFTFRSMDIGVVLDLMIHDLDILLELIPSAITAIEAVGVPALSRHEDIANARLTFASGCVANLTASRVATRAVRKLRIIQRDSYLSINYGERRALLFRKRPDAPDPATIDPATIPDAKAFVYEKLIAVEEIPLSIHDALEQELIAFLHCVATGARPACSGADARRALELAWRILDSIRANRERHTPP